MITPREREFIDGLKAEGRSHDELRSALGGFRLGIQPRFEGENTEIPENNVSRLDRVSETISEAGEGVYEAISGTGEYQDRSLIGRGVGATAEAFNAIPKVAMDIAPEPVREGLEAVGGFIGKGFQSLVDKIASTDLFEGAAGQLVKSADGTVDFIPNDLGVLEDALGTASSAGQISGDILAAHQGAKVLQKGVDLTSKAGKLVSKGVKDVAYKVTEKLKVTTADTPAKIMQRVARISKSKQAKFQELSGESVGEYLTKRNIYGNIDDISHKLYKRFTDSKLTADNALAQLKGEFNPTPVRTAINDLLKRELGVSTPQAPSRILAEVQRLAAKKNWTMTEINQIKRLYEANVKVDYLKTMNPTGVAKATNIDSAIRNWQFGKATELGLKNLPGINKETQLARSLLDAIGKEYAGSAGNNWMGLSDWILISGGSPTAVASFLVKKGFSSKEVQSAIAKLLNKGKATMETVSAETAPSQVLGLPEATGSFRSVVGSGSTIKVPPKGANIDVLK